MKSSYRCPCRAAPCQLAKCPLDLRCMTELTTAMVMQAVAELLGRRPPVRRGE